MNGQRRILLAGVVFALVVLCGALWLPGARRAVRNSQSTGLDQAIRRSSDYLARQCDDDGRFVYRINLDRQFTYQPRYNILRHAGAIYALAMCHEHTPREETRRAAGRAVAFLKREAIAPVPGDEQLLAVWSRPEIHGRPRPVQAKLGGTGLGLVALLSFEKIQPGSTPIDELRRLGRFLVYMQKDDGSFYCRYFPRTVGRDDSWTSLYYPGEAALGLLMLYEKDPSPTWLQAAADAIAQLARSRQGRSRVEPDHWALLATARLLPLYGRCRQPVPREAIVRHAVQICRSMLSEKPSFPDDSPKHGCLTPDGRTCPTATRLEGLLSAMSFLSEEQYGTLHERIATAAGEAVTFLLRTQVCEGRHAGAIPRAVALPPEKFAQLTQAAQQRVSEVRIDYVQHTVSGMIQYRRMFGRR